MSSGIGDVYKRKKWTKIYFGVGYDAGLINISKDKVKPQLGSVKTGSFYITIGYNF